MPSDSQRPKSAKISPVSQCEETERNDDQQDGLFMDMPTK